LAITIVGGSNIPMGDCTMTDKGIRATTGALFWKQHHVIPWTDVRFGTGAGFLTIGSAQNKKIKKVFSLRDTWNAVIFKEIADAVVTLQRK